MDRDHEITNNVKNFWDSHLAVKVLLKGWF